MVVACGILNEKDELFIKLWSDYEDIGALRKRMIKSLLINEFRILSVVEK